MHFFYLLGTETVKGPPDFSCTFQLDLTCSEVFGLQKGFALHRGKPPCQGSALCACFECREAEVSKLASMIMVILLVVYGPYSDPCVC